MINKSISVLPLTKFQKKEIIFIFFPVERDNKDWSFEPNEVVLGAEDDNWARHNFRRKWN